MATTDKQDEEAGEETDEDVQAVRRQQVSDNSEQLLNEQLDKTVLKMKTNLEDRQTSAIVRSESANIAMNKQQTAPGFQQIDQASQEQRQSSRRDSVRSTARATDHQQQRSRSRGRTPSELLARKQQLLMTNGSGSSHLSPSVPHLSSRMNGLASDGDGVAQQQQQQLTAEAKLESLSELLKSHQVAGAATVDEDNQFSEMNLNELASRQQQQQQQQQPSLKSIDDVYILLAKKEKDLQLAAELGKVLLERNDELSKANERIAEEYSRKLELLEQEKHKLKRKLDLLDGEYENRIIELQTDSNILKNKLEQQQQAGKQADREKSKLIDDLVKQNQRLTSELAEATRSEELLSGQLEQVNERLNARLSNRSDHVAQVDALQDEILVLNKRKQDLERRLKLAQNEKANLVATIEETSDKVLILDNLLNEKDLKLGELAIEINELRDSSSWLSIKLESMISLNERLVGNDDDHDGQDANGGGGGGGGGKLSELKAMSERERSHLIEQLKDLRLKRNSRIKANEMILQNAAERQRRSLLTNIRRSSDSKRRSARARTRRQRRRLLLDPKTDDGDDDADDGNESYSSDNDDDDADDGDRATNSSNDLIGELYAIFSDLYANLLERKERLLRAANATNSNNNTNYNSMISGGGGRDNNQVGAINQHDDQLNGDASGINLNDDSGIGSADESATIRVTTPDGLGAAAAPLHDVVQLDQWRKLVENLRQLIEEMPCTSCQLMIGERADYEQLRKLHARVCDEIRLKNDELLQCSAENIEQKAKLSALDEKCQLIQGDLDNCDKPKEEIVRLAWKARDEAVGRKNNAEIQLAKTRIENMQISSQLMEVVQQKGELSQKLAQFEDDIHYMMQRSVNARFSWEQYADETRRLAGSRSGHGHMGKEGAKTTTASGAASSIQQLLNLSSIALLSPKRSAAAATAQIVTTKSGSPVKTGPPIGAPAAASGGDQQLESLAGATNNLLTNIKSSRFNLRFWQRTTGTSEQEVGSGGGGGTGKG